jgi:hypothetical protein
MRAALTNLAARRRTLVLVLIAALAASTAAWAYWAAKSSGSASGHVGSLTAPSIGSATAGGGTVTLSWGAVTAPGAGTVSYYVRRDGGAASSACPSSSAPATQTSCTDTSVATGTHSYTVTAVWHSWTATSSSASAQVLTGAATHLVLTPATTSPTAGTGDNLTITAKDASNNTVTSYTGTMMLTFSGASTIGAFRPLVTASNGTAIAFGSSEPISFSSGVASGSAQGGGAMTLYKAETASIKVSDGAIDNGSGVTVTVAPAGADSFALGTPSTQTAGTAFSETLTAKDAYGNTATSYSGKQAVAFSGPSSSPSGKAPSYPATVSFSAGAGTATPITLYDADEGATLSASQGAISGSSASFAVNPTTATGFALASVGTQTAGVSFSETITARDTYGNTATGYNGKGTVAFSGPSSSPSGKAPSYPSPVSFNAGIATATPITLYDAQTTTLTATQSTLSGTSPSFSVAAATAGSFTVPTPSTQTAGSAFNLTLTAKDAYGNTATSYEGPKTLAFSGPTESPAGEAPKYPGSVTFAAGSATVAITLFDAGSTTLTAKDGTITGSTGNFTVNAKSTTTQFGVSVPASVSAGTAFNATLTAEDTYGNTTSGYTGNRTIAFSGPAKSPSGKSPSYDTSLFFSSGKTTETATLYDAQTTTLVAKESFGSISGESESFAVASASPSSFGVATPGTQAAGTAFSLTITGAKDSFGNLVGGTQTVGFSGPSSAPDGTTPSYPSSATFTAGEAKAAVTLSDAQTTSVKVTSGSASATSSSFTVGPATMTALSLTAGDSTLFAGQGDELTIKAVDTFENTVTSYTGPQTLWFSGAKASGVKAPTVSNSSGTPVPFESPTTIAFAAGVAKTSGTSGLMKLYTVETAHVAVSDHMVSSGSGLPITVEATLISSLTLSNAGGFSGKGKIESGDSFAVKLGAPLAVNSVCSLWSGNTTNHSLSGNNEVTVTIVDGTGATHDSVTVGASKCTLHLGTIDLGSSAYVSGGNATFTGTGSNASSVEYKASTNTLEVELGGTKGGLGKVAQVSSSAATLTPDTNLTDEFGNVFPAFTTATTSEF